MTIGQKQRTNVIRYCNGIVFSPIYERKKQIYKAGYFAAAFGLYILFISILIVVLNFFQ